MRISRREKKRFAYFSPYFPLLAFCALAAGYLPYLVHTKTPPRAAQGSGKRKKEEAHLVLCSSVQFKLGTHNTQLADLLTYLPRAGALRDFLFDVTLTNQ